MIATRQYRLLLASLLLATAACQPHVVGAEAQAGGLVDPGAVAPGWRLPDNVIDTRELPHFTLRPGGKADTPLPVYRLAPDTYFLFGNIAILDEDNRGWNGNAGFVVTPDGVVVIDTLGTPELGRRLIATIRSITTAPVRYLIVTHNHPDHAYGAAAFQALEDVTVIAHAGTLAYNNSETLQESVAYRRDLLPGDMQGFAPLQPDVLVPDTGFGKLDVELGGKHFSVYNTGRHHSYGDLVVYQADEAILWVSDLAFNQRTTFLGDGDSGQILAAQSWLLEQFPEARLMVPGHGAPQRPPFPMVANTRRYVERLRSEMRAAVEQGVGLYDATRQSTYPEWQDTRLYEENHRVNASFVYREMERAYFDSFE